MNARGVAITAPAGWSVEPTTLDALLARQKAITAANPTLARALGAAAKASPSGVLRFYAIYAPDVHDYAANVAVDVVPADGMSLTRAIQFQEPAIRESGATNLHSSLLTLPKAGTAGELTYTVSLALPSGAHQVVYDERYVVESGANVGVLTIATDDPTAEAGAIRVLTDSFHLT